MKNSNVPEPDFYVRPEFCDWWNANRYRLARHDVATKCAAAYNAGLKAASETAAPDVPVTRRWKCANCGSTTGQRCFELGCHMAEASP